MKFFITVEKNYEEDNHFLITFTLHTDGGVKRSHLCANEKQLLKVTAECQPR